MLLSCNAEYNQWWFHQLLRVHAYGMSKREGVMLWLEGYCAAPQVHVFLKGLSPPSTQGAWKHRRLRVHPASLHSVSSNKQSVLLQRVDNGCNNERFVGFYHLLPST